MSEPNPHDTASLERVSDGWGPVYRTPAGKFVVLTMEGDIDNRTDPRWGEWQEFDSVAEAEAYVRGVDDAAHAQDLRLEVVSKALWFLGNGPNHNDEDEEDNRLCRDCAHRGEEHDSFGSCLVDGCSCLGWQEP